MNPTDSHQNYYLSYPNAVRTVFTPGFNNFAKQIYLTDFSISGPLVGMKESRDFTCNSMGLALGACGLHSYTNIHMISQMSSLAGITGIFGVIIGTYMFKTCVDGWNEVANERKKSIESNELLMREYLKK
jgi:hypothetical protein